MKSRDVIKLIEAAGWAFVRQSGSHRQYHHPDRQGTVTVAHPNSDVGIGTLKSIEKQSGVKLR